MKSSITLLITLMMGMSFAAGGGPNPGKGKAVGNEASVTVPQDSGKSHGVASNEGQGNKFRLRKGLTEDFQKGMPADLKEKVEALKEEANRKRQMIAEASPEEAKAIRHQWRRGSQQKKNAAVATLPQEKQGKILGMLKKMNAEKMGKDEEMRKRQNAARKVREKLLGPVEDKKSLDVE